MQLGTSSGFRHRYSRCAGLIAIVCLSACNAPELRAFSSDGCSMFPDRSANNDWCSCCFEHDLIYWRGGTEAERQAADERLRDCVLAKTGNESLAKSMYRGVRAGGHPLFYTWYRWGYGWPYGRGFKPLTSAEKRVADRLVEEYYESNEVPACAPVPESNEVSQRGGAAASAC